MNIMRGNDSAEAGVLISTQAWHGQGKRIKMSGLYGFFYYKMPKAGVIPERSDGIYKSQHENSIFTFFRPV